MTNEEDVEKKKGSVIFSLVSYVSINCIRFTGMISAYCTPTRLFSVLKFIRLANGFLKRNKISTFSEKNKKAL